MLERCDCCGVYKGMTGTPEAGKVVRVENAYAYMLKSIWMRCRRRTRKNLLGSSFPATG